MKKLYLQLTTSVFFLLMSINSASATVGGETVLYNFLYKNTDESVYYTKQNFGGRGCPPELLKTSLNSEQSTVVYSCDTGERLSPEKVTLEINKITNSFKPLIPINLKSNSISVDIAFVRNENYSFEISELYRRHFTATIYQNGKKIKEISITGCNLDQPFVFQGYSIPGFNKKIIMLLSTKGDCNEGGYINETLHVLGGLEDIHKTEIPNFYKGPSALKLNEGGLVVYEADKVSIENTTDTNEPQVASTTPNQTLRKSIWVRLLEWLRNIF